MKNIILIFACINILFSLQAQTPPSGTISGTSFTVDPFTDVSFTLTLFNEPSGFTREEIFWTGAGITNSNSTEATSTNGTTQFKTQYKNQSNTPANDISASVTYRKRNAAGNVTDTKLITSSSTVKTVIVRFIGPITQLSIGGSGVSFTNLSNGGSVQLACGQQSLSLNIPTPITDPSSAITYTWQFPWGTQTTSTPSVSTTSNVGQTDGTVIVSAKRTDGTFVQTFGFSMIRPRVGLPTIVRADGASITEGFCPGQRRLFQGASLTNVTTYKWTTTGGLNYLGTTVGPTFFVGGTTKGSITLSVDNACLSPQAKTIPVYLGNPTIENATVNGQPPSMPNYISNPCLVNMWTNETGVSYTWQITNGTGSIYYNGMNQVSVYAYPFVRVDGSITNQCGSTSTSFYLYNAGGGYYRMTSPNPTTNTVSIEIPLMDALKKVTLVSDNRSGIVRMYNANGSLNGNTHRNNNDLSFDVANLPRGLYYLNFVFDGNKTFTEQIVLE